MKKFIRAAVCLWSWLAICMWIPARAAVYTVPANGDTVVGRLHYVFAHKSDTLVDLARRFDVGFNEITSVNPTIDPWLPPKGALVVIPSQFVLPEKPWRGIVINLAEMRLYYFPEPAQSGAAHQVYTFPLGIGRSAFPTPVGSYHIIDKLTNPIWTVPASALREAKAKGITMPAQVPPGEDNPLGKFALQLNKKDYLIHGTNKPFGIGRRVSHGCLRLYPEDIARLFQQVPRGTPVRIENTPVRFGKRLGVLYVESNRIDPHKPPNRLDTEDVNQIIALTTEPLNRQEWGRVSHSLAQSLSIPIPVTGLPMSVGKSTPMYLQVNSGAIPQVTPRLNGIFGQDLGLTTVGPCGKVKKCSRLGPLDSREMGQAVATLLRDGYSLSSRLLSVNARPEHTGLISWQ